MECKSGQAITLQGQARWHQHKYYGQGGQPALALSVDTPSTGGAAASRPGRQIGLERGEDSAAKELGR